jgi:site-specific DNA-methyltransferase (adenine-specific)
MIARADAARLPLPDKSVDLIVGSPPYLDARTYGDAAIHSRNLGEWVAWMLDVTAEAVRVSRGLVLWVCAGVTREWCYQPGPEGLLYEWVKRGGIAWRPCYWHRYGIPGSGGKQWYRADVEYALAFTADRGMLPYGEPTANGRKPVCVAGGAMSNRLANGKRVVNMTRRRIGDGARLGNQPYVEPDLANPGVLLQTGATGGGNIGHALAHDNEAPYPVEVPAWFIRSHSPPGGWVCDPFSGSGTSWDAAKREGRRFVGFDLRQSQCDLSRRRAATVTPGFAFAFESEAAR